MSFVIALPPEGNVFEQKRRFMPLVAYLSQATGMNVQSKILDSYDSIYNEISKNKVDAAFFGSVSFVAMNSKILFDPVARPLMQDGTSTYRGVIFVRKDSGITADVRTWKGKRIALVHKSTMSGYIFPKWLLYKKGVKDFEGHFSRVVYAGSHDAAIFAVFTKDADIGCAKDLLFNELLKKEPSLREKLKVIAISDPVPSNTLGIRKDKDLKLRTLLKEALLNMDKTPEGRKALSDFGATRFIETKEEEFALIPEMFNTLGLKPEDVTLGEAIGQY